MASRGRLSLTPLEAEELRSIRQGTRSEIFRKQTRVRLCRNRRVIRLPTVEAE